MPTTKSITGRKTLQEVIDNGDCSLYDGKIGEHRIKVILTMNSSEEHLWNLDDYQVQARSFHVLVLASRTDEVKLKAKLYPHMNINCL